MRKGNLGLGVLVVIELLRAGLVSGRDMIFGPWTAQTLHISQEKSSSGSEAVQALATTECFIAVWKCLFSEHKFRGQIQGMSRNKAYHHVSRADKDNLLYLAFVQSQSEES